MNRARRWAAVVCCGAAIAACGSTSATITARPDTNLGITASLTMSGALQGAVTVDNDGSSLDAGRMGCTQPDISGEIPFGILFLGHVPGQGVATLQVSIAQMQSNANVANPHIKVTFPDAADASDIDVQQGGVEWNAVSSGTLSIDLSGATETGTVDAEISGGAEVPGPVTTLHVSGTWSCTITT